MLKVLKTAVAITLVGSPPALADCDQPVPDFEMGICEFQQFRESDAKLNQIYQDLYAHLAPAAQTALRHQELAWIASRGQRCTTTINTNIYVSFSCAISLTTARLAILQNQLTAPSQPEAYNGRFEVLATAMPWLWAADGLNSTYHYSRQDGTGPTTLTLSGLHAKPDQKLKIQYISGTVTVAPGLPPTDANGDADLHQFAYGGPGSTGTNLPSQYIKPYPIPAGELLGAFTGPNGELVSSPFAIGDGPLVIKIPANAANLQLGINDDLYADNTGTYTAAVTVLP